MSHHKYQTCLMFFGSTPGCLRHKLPVRIYDPRVCTTVIVLIVCTESSGTVVINASLIDFMDYSHHIFFISFFFSFPRR